MPRPERVEFGRKLIGDDIAYSYMDNMPEVDSGTRNFLDLSKLNGSNVSIRDVWKGNYEGFLTYNLFDNKYSLKTSKGIINLKVRNLEKVTEKESLN